MLEGLRATCPTLALDTAPDACEAASVDALNPFRARPDFVAVRALAVAEPADAGELSAVVRSAAAEGVPLVARGGGSGLMGAAAAGALRGSRPGAPAGRHRGNARHRHRGDARRPPAPRGATGTRLPHAVVRGRRGGCGALPSHRHPRRLPRRLGRGPAAGSRLAPDRLRR